MVGMDELRDRRFKRTSQLPVRSGASEAAYPSSKVIDGNTGVPSSPASDSRSTIRLARILKSNKNSEIWLKVLGRHSRLDIIHTYVLHN